MRKTVIALLALAFALTAVVPALAEDPAPSATTGSGQQAQNTEAKNLRKEIVKLKYVRAQDIQNILYGYTSRDGHISFNPNMPSVLSVSDTPENVDKMLAAIREIDVKPADVLYTVQLVLGSKADATTDAELRNDPIIKQIGDVLRFKGYTLLDATLVRSVNLDRAKVTFGPKAEFDLELRPEVTGDAKMPVIKTDVRLQQTRMRQTDPNVLKTEIVTLIESTLNIKSGDRTVVGVSKPDGGDKGLILIISAKIVD
jgi:hypothetical protein